MSGSSRFPSFLRVPAQGLALSAVAALVVVLLDPFQQVFAARVAILIIVAISLNLLISGAGLLSLAGGAFLGMGAYSVTIAAQQFSWPLVVSIPVVVVVTGLIGWVLGIVSIRVSHFYLALTTLGFLTLFQVVLRYGGDVTGASYGLVPPLPQVFGYTLRAQDLAIVAALVASFGVVFARSFLDSRTGLAWRLMRESTVAAESFGVNVTLIRTSAFAWTAAALALAGSLYAFVLGAVTPDSFNLTRTIDQLVYVVVGGLGSVAGSVLGPLVLETIPEVFRGLENYREFFFGALVLVILIASPRGLAGLLSDAWQRIASPRVRAAVRKLGDSGLTIGGQADPGVLLEPLPLGALDGVAAVEYRGVTIAYGGNVAVDDLSFVVRPGTIHGVIGPNGAGKTTALNALTGQVGLVSGQILVNGEVVRSPGGGVPTRKLLRHGIARTFQTPIVIPDRTVLENVKIGLYPFGKSGIIGGTLKPPRVRRSEAEAARRAVAALELVGFEREVSAPVSQLSFGELRKLEIARALVSEPSVLLLDEPTSGLEPEVASEILSMLRGLQAKASRPLTIIIVEHNVPLILRYCDDVTAIAEGTLVASESAATIRHNPEVRRSYLGEQFEMEELEREESQRHA
jgi:ABC-type branched-subunit amino acid transport system ATPase component/ABC-type branched-subunit amino acid transport system permease subunit